MKLLLAYCLTSFTLAGQDTKRVMEPVDLLFDGMKRGDSAAVHRAFHSSSVLNTVYVDSKTNQPVLRGETLREFLNAVGKPHTEVWNELIWSPKIEIDGNFAQVWVNYAFYVDTKFSHCGVDAFHLFRDGSGAWKIFSLSDTRQKVGCEVPAEVSGRVK